MCGPVSPLAFSPLAQKKFNGLRDYNIWVTEVEMYLIEEIPDLETPYSQLPLMSCPLCYDLLESMP